MAGKKGMKHYSLEFRQEMLKLLDGGKSLNALCREFSLNESQVKNWRRWRRQYGVPKQLTGRKRGRPSVTGNETLEQKIKRLEMENTLLKKFHELLMEEETKQK